MVERGWLWLVHHTCAWTEQPTSKRTHDLSASNKNSHHGGLLRVAVGWIPSTLQQAKHAGDKQSMPAASKACRRQAKHAGDKQSMPATSKACRRQAKHAGDKQSMPATSKACRRQAHR
jgi:hypothetical protein